MDILSSFEDLADWDKLAAHCDSLSELTAVERDQAKRAFGVLRAELGDDFLHVAFQVGHPIIQDIVNQAPWTRRRLTWFAGGLTELKDSPGYQGLVGRLKDKDRFAEGLSVLEVAHRLAKAGFRITFDPGDKERGQKVPDLQVTNSATGEDLYVEVSTLGPAVAERDASRTMERILDPLWRLIPFMHYCGRIHKALSDRHLAEIVAKVERIAEKVPREQVFEELIIEDVVELAVAPDEKRTLLEEWATHRSLRVGEFSGPPFDVDEIQRTRRRVEMKQRQVPHDRPNVLVIRNNSLFLRSGDMRAVIGALEEVVYGYPHLLSVVIVGGHLGSGENIVIMKDQHTYIQRTRFGVVVEKAIILLNRFCDVKVSPSSITRVFDGFRRW